MEFTDPYSGSMTLLGKTQLYVFQINPKQDNDLEIHTVSSKELLVLRVIFLSLLFRSSKQALFLSLQLKV